MPVPTCGFHEEFTKKCFDCVSIWLKYCSFCDQFFDDCVCEHENVCPCGNSICIDFCLPDDDDQAASQSAIYGACARELKRLIRDEVPLPAGSKSDRRIRARRI